MSKVHILPENVISKIAAGEVIERPAAVIKELIENALDAGADTIEVQLKEAGKSLIRVKDTGGGIGRDDLEKIFLRHATSKIESADDLHNIQSLGFRGEALYSIGAIADVVLRSRTHDSAEGWEIHFRGGKKISLRPCSLPRPGTDIEVKELFFNTPARKKFLKGNTTELHQILSTFIPYTLLHNNLRFKLSHQEKDLIDAAPCGDKKSRIAHVLNLDERHILEIKQAFAEEHLFAHLILGDINIKRARRDMQFVFVNNRPVQNRSIGFHLNQIYRLILPERVSPFFAVFIEVPAEDVDVNIHPSKREVKIKDEQKICSVLRRLCEQTLMQSGQMKQAEAQNLVPLEGIGQKTVERAFLSTPAEEAGFHDTLAESPGRDYAYRCAEEQPTLFIPQERLSALKEESLRSKLSNARSVGIFRNKFLLFESGDSLLMIDQHAAAERVTYERLIRHMNKGSVEAQRLLSPVLIKLSPPELLLWEELKQNLEKMGLESNLWDEETIAVQSYPVFLKDIERSVRQILSGDAIAAGDHDSLARRACRSSVMAGDALKDIQAQALRDQLLQCLDPFTCPHGRPTVVEMTTEFLDKQFLRA
jgi:DNA mismatch repair protein MutL